MPLMTHVPRHLLSKTGSSIEQVIQYFQQKAIYFEFFNELNFDRGL
jgi:hypothetical protein